MKLLLYSILFFSAIGSTQGQKKVGSTSFNLLLKAMLSHSVPELTISKLSSIDTSSVFLDAREKAEFQVSSIPNATWVGYESFDLKTVNDLDKSAPIVVYCSIGYRSEKVAEQLINAGFTNVKNLYGGIFEYVNQELPLIDTEGNQTNKIHAYSKTWGMLLKKGEKVY